MGERGKANRNNGNGALFLAVNNGTFNIIIIIIHLMFILTFGFFAVLFLSKKKVLKRNLNLKRVHITIETFINLRKEKEKKFKFYI